MSSKKNIANEQDPVLFRILSKLLDLERETEKNKVQLSLKCDFNLIDAFRLLDPNG